MSKPIDLDPSDPNYYFHLRFRHYTADKIALYHLTPVANTKTIQKKGIKASKDGWIYLFTDMIVADVIAKHQVFTSRYSVFGIVNKGFIRRPRPDNVGEDSRGFQRRVRQPVIAPEHIKLIGTYDVIAEGVPTAWDYVVHEHRRGQTRAEVDAEFADRAWQRQARDDVAAAFRAGKHPDGVSRVPLATGIEMGRLAHSDLWARVRPDGRDCSEADHDHALTDTMLHSAILQPGRMLLACHYCGAVLAVVERRS